MDSFSVLHIASIHLCLSFFPVYTVAKKRLNTPRYIFCYKIKVLIKKVTFFKHSTTMGSMCCRVNKRHLALYLTRTFLYFSSWRCLDWSKTWAIMCAPSVNTKHTYLDKMELAMLPKKWTWSSWVCLYMSFAVLYGNMVA